MNELRNCVILFNKKTNKYEDKSKEILKIENDKENGKFNITFVSGKRYEYNKSSVEWLTNPISLDISNKLIYSNNMSLSNVKEVLDFGSWVKVVFNNEIRSYTKESIKIVRNRKEDYDVKNFLEYLKNISEVVNEILDENSGFIQGELNRIEISDESILYKFLNNEPISKDKINGELIFPLKTNRSQIQAVQNALSYDISAIQGPPGTGKTQTIINIIANLLIRNKTVAVVSGNNEATRNVQEKLAKEQLSSISAFLGKGNNVKAFFAAPQIFPNIEVGDANDIGDKEFSELTANALKIYEYRVRCAEIDNEILEFAAEKSKNDFLYSQSIKSELPKSILNWTDTSQKYLELAAYLETILSKKRIGILDKIRLRCLYKLRNCKAVMLNAPDCIDYLQNKYYQVKLSELEYERNAKRCFLANTDNVKTLSDFEQLSMLRLKLHLSKYYDKLPQYNFDIKNYRSSFSKFNKRYPVIFSTTHALRMCSGQYLYDYVIIDESSQVDLASAVIAMSCAKRIVFVGDLKQLPHIVKSSYRQALKDVFSSYALPSYYEYSQNSILQCITAKYGETLPNVLLNEHWRCDPQIIGFCNKRFYNGQLHIQTKHEQGNGLTIVPSPANSEDGRQNKAQVDIIKKEILPKISSGSIGIVAPYCKQVELIKQNVDSNQAFVETVHKFQGKERDNMILSTVSNKVAFYEDEEKTDFLNNENLINVALSRAQSRLYVIASRQMMQQQGTLVNELVRYAKYYCGSDAIEESKVYSVFELMYQEYSPILEQLKKRLLHISDFQSENIMATVLQDICKSGQYGMLSFKFRYPLRKIIHCETLFDAEDRQFVENVNTHCDFVVYDVIDKSIRLVVEVDGKQHEDKLQRKRDERKDKLLKNANIALLRVKTTDIDCESKVKTALSQNRGNTDEIKQNIQN